MAEKKDIYFDGRIYVGVTPASFGRADHWNTESEAEHNAAFEAYINHITSFTSYPVSGSHSFIDGQDVTGLYELKLEIRKDYKSDWLLSTDVFYNNWLEEDRRIIAISSPVPPVKDMEAEGREKEERQFDTTYSALQYAGNFIDENMLFKGLYFTNTPALYDASDTLEDLIKRHSELIGRYMPGSPVDVYVENLKQCKLVKVRVNIRTV